ncbi:mitogen-activated protein kinase kinase 3 isoform X2 [Prunus yedoensis var. nudiflora]|uniref:mitogen-activated protein kinase kinase n=1 Tax=Prunus yedoensis var. nudiflora TaxID=2094558 RepID=A0A314Z7Q8_PRUYE|nr:mitogen-activated protein kinase kinase 3 isoform X2 [Prunus yedoensis var. nudiflora]
MVHFIPGFWSNKHCSGVYGWRIIGGYLKIAEKNPEPLLSSMFQKLLHGLSYLHGVRHLVHRDIKPANLLVNLKGFMADIGDPSPTPSKQKFSPEFCSFIEACLQKDADARPTAEQLLSHPFITKSYNTFYLLFDGPDELWQHTRTLYSEDSVFSFSGKQLVGPNDIFASLSSIRSTLAGDWPPERLVHVVEKLQCRAHGQDGVAIRVSGSFIVGNQFLICGDGVQVEGLPSIKDLSIDISSKRMGTFRSSSLWSQAI